jgi:hypothetical protein
MLLKEVPDDARIKRLFDNCKMGGASFHLAVRLGI